MGSSCSGKVRKEQDVDEAAQVQKESFNNQKRPPALNFSNKCTCHNNSINGFNTGCSLGSVSKHSNKQAFDFMGNESTLVQRKNPKIKISINIGEGPNGKVYECLNQETGEICAIKIFESKNPSSRQTQDNGNNKNNQIEQVGKEDSKENQSIDSGIFQIKEILDLRNVLMQYMEGRSVKDLLKKFGRLDLKIIAKYIKQAFMGLQFLHTHNVMHGNLKCSNLLVDTKGNIKLCDFFNEKDSQKQKQELENLDIKQMGATIIEMLTGTYPNLSQTIDLQFLNQQWKDFISICLESKMNISQLLEHEIMKNVQIPVMIEKGTSPIVLVNQNPN